jgi:hypothetical protein
MKNSSATPSMVEANSKNAKLSPGRQSDKGKKASEGSAVQRDLTSRIGTNGQSGVEYRGLKPATPKTSESPRSVVADREKTSPAAQSQMATTSNGKSIGVKHPSSPPSSNGPLKIKTDGDMSVTDWASVERTFGTSDADLSAELLLQVTRALPRQEVLDPHGNYALAALHGMSPRDTIEGLLSAQMVSVHNLSMELFRQAALPGQTPEAIELYLNLATKLQRTFVAQMEALDRHRGKGEQKMNVEQVHIYDRAQGINVPFIHQGSVYASAEDRGKSD